MILIVFLVMASIMTKGTNQTNETVKCGGVLTAAQGTIQTPNFPSRFTVPIHCRWVIDISQHKDSQNSSIVVYFTQLFVSDGLTFTEFDYYESDSTLQLGGRVIHRVTEQNATVVQWLLTRRQYLVVDLSLDRLEGHHLRVLDNLLDVYGFNLTYQTGSGVQNSSCSMVSCSLSGNCLVSEDYSEFWCSCFPGFSGKNCGQGSLCQTARVCYNGASCRQAGAATAICICPDGFTGSKCEVPTERYEDCEEGDICTLECEEDSSNLPCACKGARDRQSKERARYEGTVRLNNVSAVRSCLDVPTTCSLKPNLTKQIARYLKSSNLTLMEDLKVIDVGLSGEVRFHFWGGKKEGSRVREVLNRLVQKGRLGNTSLVPTHLAITQEPTLLLKSVIVNQARQKVRQGEEFIISCSAQGSSHISFRWFKDNVPIDITKASRSMWTRLLPLDTTEQYTSLLGVSRADPLDQGRYTCQVVDWGYQQCQSLSLDVPQPPRVIVQPMSVTVEKGENVTITCFSDDALHLHEKLGYSWSKNKSLFKMTPGQEYWEDLYPRGTILRVFNVQRSVTYTCHVHGSVKPVLRSVRVEVLDRSAVPWCEEENMLSVKDTQVGVAYTELGVATPQVGVTWPKAGPGGVAKLECPPFFTGVASRLCLLVDRTSALWQSPDFSNCVSDNLDEISKQFHKLTLGYGNVTIEDTLSSILNTLLHTHTFYPGGAEPVVSLLNRITFYSNRTSGWGEEIANSSKAFFSIVNILMQHKNNFIHSQKVEELIEVVKTWSFLWARQFGSTRSHLSYESLSVDLYRFEPSNLTGIISIPDTFQNFSRPTLTPGRIVLRLSTSSSSNHNQTASLVVVTYKTLSDLLPQRFSQLLDDGNELQYEVTSPSVSLLPQGLVLLHSVLEMSSFTQPGWSLHCAVSRRPTLHWDMTACNTLYNINTTLCKCRSDGVYALLRAKLVNQVEQSGRLSSKSAVLVGCVCCLVQSLLTLFFLTLHFWKHRTCLSYLKIQCCSATAVSMTVLLYTTSQKIPQESFSVTSTLLQASILISMSSHLSKVLLIYTEVIHLPQVKYIRQTIICLITGTPVLVVLCNHIAVSSTAVVLSSWWLAPSTLVFYSCVFCALFILFAFFSLLLQVSRTLQGLKSVKCEDTIKAISRRMGLLIRSSIVLLCTVFMAVSSVIFVNINSSRYQYLFSFSSALLGFSLLTCYVLYCESSLHLNMLKKFKLDSSFSSDSGSSILNFFTKQVADRECKDAPLKTADSSVGAVLVNRNVQHSKQVLPILKTPRSRDQRKIKTVTFKGDSVLVADIERAQKDPMCVEVYPSSPRRYPDPVCIPCSCPYPGPPLACQCPRVCVITNVVVDTPSVVFCSVDVEPYYTLNQTIVHASTQELHKPLELVQEEPPLSQGDVEVSPEDVMDRICHDLDYLLEDVPQPSGNHSDNSPTEVKVEEVIYEEQTLL